MIRAVAQNSKLGRQENFVAAVVDGFADQHFVVAITVILPARQEPTVKIAGEIRFLGVLGGFFRLGRRHIRQERPVTQQDRDKQDRLDASAREQEDERSDPIADGDALQDAGVAERFEAELQQIVVDETEKEKERNPPC